MSSEVVGWGVFGSDNRQVFVCAPCLKSATSEDADLYDAAQWANDRGLAGYGAPANEVLRAHPEASQNCTNCGYPLDR